MKQKDVMLRNLILAAFLVCVGGFLYCVSMQILGKGWIYLFELMGICLCMAGVTVSVCTYMDRREPCIVRKDVWKDARGMTYFLLIMLALIAICCGWLAIRYAGENPALLAMPKQPSQTAALQEERTTFESVLQPMIYWCGGVMGIILGRVLYYGSLAMGLLIGKSAVKSAMIVLLNGVFVWAYIGNRILFFKENSAILVYQDETYDMIMTHGDPYFVSPLLYPFAWGGALMLFAGIFLMIRIIYKRKGMKQETAEHITVQVGTDLERDYCSDHKKVGYAIFFASLGNCFYSISSQLSMELHMWPILKIAGWFLILISVLMMISAIVDKEKTIEP